MSKKGKLKGWGNATIMIAQDLASCLYLLIETFFEPLIVVRIKYIS